MASVEKPPQASSPSMNYFASWELSNRLNPGWVPRELSLNISHIKLLQAIDIDPGRPEILKFPSRSIVIAVSAETSRHILRSTELELGADNRMDVNVRLKFTLPYAHSLKHDTSNQLTISIQRRKRYKHRPIKGYKSLASAVVNLSQILQRDFSGSIEVLDKDGQVFGILTIKEITTSSLEGRTGQDDAVDSEDSLDGEVSDLEDDERAHRRVVSRKPIGQLRKFMTRMLHDPKLLPKLRGARVGRRIPRAQRSQGLTAGSVDEEDDEDDDEDDDEAAELDEIALLEMLRMGSEVASLYSDESDVDDIADARSAPYLRPFYASPSETMTSPGPGPAILYPRDELQERYDRIREESPTRQNVYLSPKRVTSTSKKETKAEARSPSKPRDRERKQSQSQLRDRMTSPTLQACTVEDVNVLLGREPECLIIGSIADPVFCSMVQGPYALQNALSEPGKLCGLIVLPSDSSTAQLCLASMLAGAESIAKEREARSGVRTGLVSPFTCLVFSSCRVVADLLHALFDLAGRVKPQPTFRVAPTVANEPLCQSIAQYDPKYARLFASEDWLHSIMHYTEPAMQTQVVERLQQYISSATEQLSFEAAQVRVQSAGTSISIPFLSSLQFSSIAEVDAENPNQEFDFDLDVKALPDDSSEKDMASVKGNIRHVAVVRVQNPTTRDTSKPPRLHVSVTRLSGKAKLKLLLPKKELTESKMDIEAESIMCKPRNKARLCLIVDGCVHSSLEQCYVTTIYPTSNRRLVVQAFGISSEPSSQPQAV
eukprot:m.187522 g.187522  ORF g.187522 m.187522 type:complete len:772 (+) comp16713_c2_seq2:202-2517(+)